MSYFYNKPGQLDADSSKALQDIIKDLVIQTIVPHMEKTVQQLNEQVLYQLFCLITLSMFNVLNRWQAPEEDLQDECLPLVANSLVVHQQDRRQVVYQTGKQGKALSIVSLLFLMN
jgi:hypothetical protein